MSVSKFAALRRMVPPVQELEIVFKSGSSVQSVDLQTGEFITSELIYKKDGGIGSRVVPSDCHGMVDRFSLQTVAKKALSKYRVSKCLRVPVDQNHHIGVYKNAKFGTVFFSGLQTCGSVWHCPVCAAKISERRAEEVQQAINYTLLRGGWVSFVTRTVPHSDTDTLFEILTKYRLADKLYKGSRFYKSSLENFGCFGCIKVFEITVGINGWHLHVHEIMLHDATTITNVYECLENNLYRFWADAAVKAGFDLPSRAHGLQVQNGDFAAAYLAKFGKETTSNWNSSRELTKQHIKKSKSGFSPFDLFRAYRDKPDNFLLELITEYGETMHGARQLIWSRGLKKLIELQEVSDKEIADQMDEEAAILGRLSLEQWRFIIKRDLRVDVLLMAKYHGFDALTAFLGSQGCPAFQNL